MSIPGYDKWKLATPPEYEEDDERDEATEEFGAQEAAEATEMIRGMNSQLDRMLERYPAYGQQCDSHDVDDLDDFGRCKACGRTAHA